ncbi:NACHT, LRR and PYD domains-containing protein 12-like [Lithobates pipiens]
MAVSFTTHEWMNPQTPGDLIVYSLEDLKGYDFKKVKNKLSELSYGDKLPIPRGSLENVDCITTKDLLIDTYGKEEALDVMCKVFELVGLLGPANELQKRRTQLVNPKKTVLNNKLFEWKKEYMMYMKENFQRVKDYNSCLGEAVYLQKRYTNVLLVIKTQDMEEKMHQILNSGRRHLRIMEKLSSDEYFPTTIQALFKPDEENFIPKIVVLQGPAGIRKTMTSKKIMLDWASGNLYPEFEFVFYLSCREIRKIIGKISLVGLLSRTCKLQCSEYLVSLLKDPGNHRKLLFIIDGFDELRWTLEEESEVYGDLFEELHIEILVQKLLRNHLLKQSSFIITTRSLALAKLSTFIEDYRCVEVLGFTEKDCEEYMYNFFKNKNDAEKALSIIKDNEILYTMCFIPITCWIVCTVMKPQIKKDFDLMQYKTVTSVYLLYLKGLIKYHGRNQPVHTCLKKLCALAREGVLNQQILFEEEDLERHELSLTEIESVFLNENVFHLDIDTQSFYSFIHLSVQEFFAALYYALDDGSRNEESTSEVEDDISLPEICKGDTLSKLCSQHPHLTLVVQFLFGFFNEKEIKTFSKSTGINIAIPARSAMEEWLINPIHKPSIDSTYAILCLYETQDEIFIKRVMSQLSHLEVKPIWMCQTWWGRNCSKQLSYCLKACESFQTLLFIWLTVDAKDLEMLSPLLHRCQFLCFEYCRLSQRICFGKMQSKDYPEVEKVTFSEEDEKYSADLEWLTNPRSKIQKLTFYKCSLTTSSCTHICSFLRINNHLTSLNLGYNRLQDSGVKLLCEGLRHPGCTLQELSLRGCHLTPLCCDDLRCVLFTNRSLTKLDLSSNNLENTGVKLLCDGLRNPGCILQEFMFDDCKATLLCCDDLCSVISTNKTLTRLETRLDMDVGISDSEANCWCGALRQLGCTVQQGIFFDIWIEIKYRSPNQTEFVALPTV